MARLEAQAKMQFYPTPPLAMEAILDRLRLYPGEEGERYPIFDPCAGEGAAIKQLAEGLGIPQPDLHLVELNDARGEKCRELLPEARILAPATLFGCTVRASCFSLVYCNPPFDDAVGGGRLERRFLDAAQYALAPKGVLVFVAPEKVYREDWFSYTILTYFNNFAAFPFPAPVRKYNETVFLAEKRGSAADPKKRRMEETFALRGHTYEVRPADGPGKRFTKTWPTDDEIITALGNSTLNRMLEPPKPFTLESPPMQLGTGHLALLLASGYLDGVVRPEGERPHVVRGVARKTEVLTETKSDQVSMKERKTVDIFTERIDLVVRAIDETGTISTFSSGGNDEPAKEKA